MTHENSTRPQELMYLTHLKQSAHIAPQIFDGSRGRCQCSNGSFQASLVTGRQKQTTILKSGRVACSTKVKLCGRKPGHTYRTAPSINISRTIVQKLHVHGRTAPVHPFWYRYSSSMGSIGTQSLPVYMGFKTQTTETRGLKPWDINTHLSLTMRSQNLHVEKSHIQPCSTKPTVPYPAILHHP